MSDVLDPCCGSRMFWFDKTDERPLFGHPSGKRAATHWIVFMKDHQQNAAQGGGEK